MRISLFALLSIVLFAICSVATDHSYILAAASIIPVAAQKNVRLRVIQNFQPAVYPQVGQRLQLPRDFVYSKFYLKMQCQVDIAAGGGADGALNAEQPWSLIRNIQIVSSAPSRTTLAEIRNLDFAAMGVLDRIFSGTVDQVAALAAPGIQAATQIIAQCEVPFYLPRTVNPRAGALNTHELSALDMVVDWGTGTDLITGGTRVITLSNGILQVSAEEYLDVPSNQAKYAVNLARTLEYPAVAASTQFPVDLKRGFPLRGVLIKTFTRAAGVVAHTPVDTKINAVSVMVNGVPKMQWASNGVVNSGWIALQAENKTMFGLEAVPAGYAFVDFMPDGQFDRLLRASDYTSIGLSLDVNTLADSVIRVYPIEIVDFNQ